MWSSSSVALCPYLCAQKGQKGIWSQFCLLCLLVRASAASLLWLLHSCYCPSSFVSMALFSVYSIQDSHLLSLERKGFLTPKEVSQ
jgi:hypothetical protein